MHNSKKSSIFAAIRISLRGAIQEARSRMSEKGAILRRKEKGAIPGERKNNGKRNEDI